MLTYQWTYGMFPIHLHCAKVNFYEIYSLFQVVSITPMWTYRFIESMTWIFIWTYLLMKSMAHVFIWIYLVMKSKASVFMWTYLLMKSMACVFMWTYLLMKSMACVFMWTYLLMKSKAYVFMWTYLLMKSMACVFSWSALCRSARTRTSQTFSIWRFEHRASSHITFNLSKAYCKENITHNYYSDQIYIGYRYCKTLIIPPATKLEGGYTGITLSFRPSVCPSVDARVVR